MKQEARTKSLKKMNEINRIIAVFKDIYDRLRGKDEEFDKWVDALPQFTKKNDILATPRWYNSRLTKREMSRRAGLSHERVRQIIIARNLPEPTPAKMSEMMPVDIPWWYDPELSINEMATKANMRRVSVYNILKHRNLTFKKNLSVFFEIYDPNKTVEEMYNDKNNTLTKESIRTSLSKNKLPFKHKIEYHARTDGDEAAIARVYSPDKSLTDIINESGISRHKVYYYLRSHNLPYKKAKLSLEFLNEVYTPEKNVKELARDAQVSHSTVRTFLRARKLGYSRLRSDTQAYRQFYDPSKTINEMVSGTDIDKDNFRRYLKRHNLPYVNKSNRACKPGVIAKVYSPDKTIQQMCEEAHVSRQSVFNYIYAHNLPYVRIKSHYNRSHVDISSVYSPDKTIKEMASDANVSTRLIFAYVQRYNLPFKRIRAKKGSKKNTKG